MDGRLIDFGKEEEINTRALILELLDFVEEYKFDRLGVFLYSHEEGTYAFDLEEPVPDEIKQIRHDRLMEAQREISLEKNLSRVGKDLQVLVDRKEGDQWIGRTAYDAPEIDNEVILKGSEIRVGEFVQARITDAAEYDLFADVM